MSGVAIVLAGPGEYLDDAAQIWAEATAARDGLAEIAPLEVARPLIERALASSASFLLVALGDEGTPPLGFAVAGPLATPDCAELRYLGVRPDAWGAGVAGQLLAALPGQLRSRGFIGAELWVYPHNQRAVDLYERMGWQRTPEFQPNWRTGRPMQRYTLAIGPSG